MTITQSPALDERDFKILEFIEHCVDKSGYPPSVREICEAANLSSTSSGHRRLRKLERAGYIERGVNLNRAIKVLVSGSADEAA